MMASTKQSRAEAAMRWLCVPVSIGVALTLAAPLGAAQPAKPIPRERASIVAAPVPDTDAQRIDDLIEANHILATEGVLDAFGHISVRSVENPKHFFMAQSRAPGLVSLADIMEFDENSQPVDQRGRQMYGERFIHGEILRARPDVNSVVHSHSPDVIPFSVTSAPLKAMIHMAAFLGQTPAPVFEIRDVLGDRNSMLVLDNTTGAALAAKLGERPVVLMRGHGMALAASSVRAATLHAIYTQLNARLETIALRLGDPVFITAGETENFRENLVRSWEVLVVQADKVWPRH